MTVDPRLIAEVVKELMRRTGLPVPAPKDVITSWSRGLGLKSRGEWYLFTGGLYQITPYIKSLIDYMQALEGKRSRIARFSVKMAASIASRIPILKPDPGLDQEARETLLSIVRLLNESGVDYAYGAYDSYTGVILYDLGLEDALRRYAASVYRRLREYEVSKVITVDPHTTHMLKNVYPEIVDGYQLEVKTYIEILDEAGIEFKGIKGETVIHDPCYYARYNNVIQQPRKLLKGAGYTVKEPARSGRMTYCCGGPLEGIAPRLAKRIAKARMEELSAVSSEVTVMCPICMANLRSVAGDGVRVVDLARRLAQAL